jgi:vancomycin resistance protein YoaR
MRQSSRWNNVSPIFIQALFVLTAGIFIFVFLWMLSILSTQIWYTGRVMPGISFAGIDLSGFSIEETAVALQEESRFANPISINLIYRDQSFITNPADLGIDLDMKATTQKAFAFGRSGSAGEFFAYHLLGRYTTHDLPPVISFNQAVALEYLVDVKRSIDQPMKDSSLQIDGTEVVALTGQMGRTMDLTASIQSIEFNMQRGNFSSIPLIVNEEQPEILDASAYAKTVKELLDKPFIFGMPDSARDSNDYRISENNLAAMLTFIRESENGQIMLIPQFREDLLNGLLAEIAAEMNTEPQDARFIFNDDTRELDRITNSGTGRELDIKKTYDAAQEAIRNSSSSIELVFHSISPMVDDNATAADLGITELVHAESSYFFGSSTARIQNIEISAAEFHGLLIGPGETFSMANAMKEVSLDNGYIEALIIFNGKTIEGVGGGVCQVSTTLFRTAFFSGFPVEERHPHAYRVSYYEKTAGNSRDPGLAGLDATVYVPLVDLKFTNDTNYWLLMETYISRPNSRITWKFYSTSDDRSVEWWTTGLVNIVKPKKPFYQENPELTAGEVKQVDWEAEGADVRVDRTVYRHGNILFEDSFFTQYAPWRAVYEYGPGTEGMPESESDD